MRKWSQTCGLTVYIYTGAIYTEPIAYCTNKPGDMLHGATDVFEQHTMFKLNAHTLKFNV